MIAVQYTVCCDVPGCGCREILPAYWVAFQDEHPGALLPAKWRVERGALVCPKHPRRCRGLTL